MQVRNFENHWTRENSHHDHLGFGRLPRADFMMTLMQPHAMPDLAQELPLVSLRSEVHSEVWGAVMLGRSKTRILEILSDTKAGVKKILQASSDYQKKLAGRNSKV